MQRTLIALLVAASFWMAACASHKPKVAPPPPPAEATAGADANGANSANAANGGVDQDTAGPQAGVLAKRTIYFDFDNSEIKGEGTDIVAAHAKYLAANPTARIRLEGNTDERGSREYNIGLGERRAQAVRHALMLQGVADNQITTVSYGAERPAVLGTGEAVWSQNRRAVTVVQ